MKSPNKAAALERRDSAPIPVEDHGRGVGEPYRYGGTTAMAIRCITLALLALGCASCQHPTPVLRPDPRARASDGRFATLSSSQYEMKLYWFQTPWERVRATPKWDPAAEFPPLSPRKAEAAALRRAIQIRPDVAKWNRDRIILREVGEDRWMYLVSFWRGDIYYGGSPFYLLVPVLMDGYAVEATTEDLNLKDVSSR